MGISERVKGQFIDVIEFVDESKRNKLLVAKYERQGDEIKQGARLIVRNGQAAVFVNKGQIADVFGPGDYKLETGNLPILSTLEAWPSRFNSPIKSDLYFINTTQFINNKWGTKNPILKRDPEMGMVRIGVFGTFSFRVTEPVVFMNEIYGARSMSMTYDIIEYLKSFVAEAVAQCLGQREESVLDLAIHYRELADTLTPYVNEKTKKFGIEVQEAAIESVNLPTEVEKLIDEQSGIGLASRDMDKFVQYQSARAIRDAAKQQGGAAGIGVGAAVGKAVVENMKTKGEEKKKEPQKEEKAAAEAEEQKEAPKAEGDAADKLIKYKELLDKGILTQEEFAELKAKLIKEL